MKLKELKGLVMSAQDLSTSRAVNVAPTPTDTLAGIKSII